MKGLLPLSIKQVIGGVGAGCDGVISVCSGGGVLVVVVE